MTRLGRWIVFSFLGLAAVLAIYMGNQIQSEPLVIWNRRLPSADCGVVLTGGSGRVREGFELLQQNKIEKLIVSGVNPSSTLEEIAPFLVYYPEINDQSNRVYLEKKSLTTFGNAKWSLKVVEDLGCKSVLLITSQIHMARAYKIFKWVYPEQVQIEKLTVNNSKSETSLLDLGLEVLKSYSYYLLRLVNL